MFADLGQGNMGIRQGSGTGLNGVLRWNYALPEIGTCRETIEGGAHFRWFIQHRKNGIAMFLAASLEKGISDKHMIQPNGYDLGRDFLVHQATRPGGIEWQGNRFNASVEWIRAGRLLNATSKNISHPEIALPGRPAIDGRVAVLTVNILSRNDQTSVYVTHSSCLRSPKNFATSLTVSIPLLMFLLLTVHIAQML